MIPSSDLKRSFRKKKKLNRVFFWSIFAIEAILLVSLIFIFLKATCVGKTSEREIYSFVALGLVLLWVGILVGYYAWAIYFYNINLGLTDSEWAEVRNRYGYIPEDAEDVRSENPHKDETLGLPKGTIRGTLALSLLVAGLAMTIASMGMDPILKANSFLVDHFDFIKTAFLMMIAFYFGNKALETIGYKSQKVIGAPDKGGSEAPGGASSAPATPQSPEPAAPATPVTNGSSPTELKNTLNAGEQEAPSEISNTPTEDQSDFDNPKAVQ